MPGSGVMGDEILSAPAMISIYSEISVDNDKSYPNMVEENKSDFFGTPEKNFIIFHVKNN